MKTKKKFLLGIDPSTQVGNNGMGLYDIEKKAFHSHFSKSLPSTFGQVQEYGEMFGVENIAIVLEYAEADGAVFGAAEALERAKKLPMVAYKKVVNQWLKRAQDVGKQKQVGKEMHQAFTHWGFTVYLLPPSARNNATRPKKVRGGLTTTNITAYTLPTKTTKKQFHDYLQYKGVAIPELRLSEHERDACTSVAGQTPQSIELFLDQLAKRNTGRKSTGWKGWVKANKNRIK